MSHPAVTPRPPETGQTHAEVPLAADAIESPTSTKEAAEPSMSSLREALHFALRNKKLVFGLSVIVITLLFAIIGPYLAHHDPLAYGGKLSWAPTTRDGYWLGTTLLGQDVFAQFATGLRLAFIVGALGGGIAALIGMLVGFTAGYRGGIVDEILNMLTNVVLVIPTFALLLVIAAYLKVRGIVTESVFIGITSWPWAARALRAQTFSLTSREFVGLARLSGESSWKIIFKEIAPNMSSYLFMMFILLFGGSILIATTLDFIGLGPSGTISLGMMMQLSVQNSALQLHLWWWFLPPGLAIMALVGSLYIMNVGLDEVFNPRLRGM
jgi:peptide/nickel transport system permease protein